MKQTLQPIKLTALQWIDTEVDLREQWQILNKLQLIDFLDVIQIQVEELQRLNCFKPLELTNLIFWKVEGSQNWQRLKALDACQLIGADEELLDPQVGQILDFWDLVPVQGKDTEAFVCVQAVNCRNVVIVQVEVLQVLVRMSVLDAHDLIAAIVDPL